METIIHAKHLGERRYELIRLQSAKVTLQDVDSPDRNGDQSGLQVENSPGGIGSE